MQRQRRDLMALESRLQRFALMTTISRGIAPRWYNIGPLALASNRLPIAYSGRAEISSIRSIGKRARSMISFGNSTCGLRFSMQS